MPFLLMIFFGLALFGSSLSGQRVDKNGAFLPTPVPTSPPRTGRYCLTKQELEILKSQPVAFYCNRTNFDRTQVIEANVPWVLASEDVEVGRIFIHDEKQLILKEICDGISYYTWKCHPNIVPKWGSLYAHTMWKLRDADPNRTPLKNGDRFDVYLRKDATPSGFWICDQRRGGATVMGIQGVFKALADLKGKIITINGKSALWSHQGKAFKDDLESAPPRRKIGQTTLEGEGFDVFVNLLKAFSPDEDKNFYLIEEDILPEDDDNLPDEVVYDVFAILETTDAKGKSLKLATFNPILPKKPWYNVYLPESKPVIYLYPQKETRIDLKIEPINGFITVSDPPYDRKKGWQNVLAHPSGNLFYQGRSYSYLYYESEVSGYTIPEDGFVIKKKDLANFFEKTLPKLGLNQKEIADFTEYWLERLEKEVKTDFLFVTFIPQEEIEKVDPLKLNVTPETVIRVRAYFKPLDAPIQVKPVTGLPKAPKRKGFTLVEWGGILDD